MADLKIGDYYLDMGRTLVVFQVTAMHGNCVHGVSQDGKWKTMTDIGDAIKMMISERTT